MTKIQISIESDGTIRFNAFCLRTDSWEDYKAFLLEAKQAQTEDNHRATNRSLRAALIFFFAHVEGVLRYICEQKKISGKGSLCEVCKRVEVKAQQIDEGIQSLNFRLDKYLRDIVAHAGLTKKFEHKDGSKETLTQESVFEQLTVDTLEELEAIISPWLDRVCRVLAVERYTDTEGMCNQIVELLGKIGPSNIQEV